MLHHEGWNKVYLEISYCLLSKKPERVLRVKLLVLSTPKAIDALCCHKDQYRRDLALIRCGTNIAQSIYSKYSISDILTLSVN